MKVVLVEGGYIDDEILREFSTLSNISFRECLKLYILSGNKNALRSNEIFVSMIEEKLKDANWWDYKDIYSIVDIPNDVEWFIGENYMGGEYVYEAHRVWY